MPNGYTIAIKSTSDESVVGMQGKIFDYDEIKTVDLVLTVTNKDGTNSADTAVITVQIPAAVKLSLNLTTSGNGTVSGSGEYFKNSSVTAVATPDSGYEFDGWYIGTDKVSSAAAYTFDLITSITLEAKFKKISRRSGGGSGSVATSYNIKVFTDENFKVYKLKKNATVNDIEIPQKDGFVFDGWYSDKELTKAVDMNTPITSSISLYPKWVKEDKTSEWKNQFTDISEKDWYFDAVKFVCEKGLFKGLSETSFSPNIPVTRGMLVTVLYRLEGEPVASGRHNFADVNADSYY